MASRILPTAVLLALLPAGAARADEVRYYEADGVTYRETRRIVRRPVVETRWMEQPQTVFREKLDVQMCPSVRTCQAPVTEYRWEARWRGRYNPFVQPYLENRLVPRTRWELRTDVVQVPVARRSVVPETTTVRVPVRTQRMVEEEVISRVAVSARPVDPLAEPPSAGLAQWRPIGGISKLDNDPPRYGTSLGPAPGSRMAQGAGGGLGSQWRPSTGTPRRY